MITSKSIALEKLRAYCAYQDRCHSEVRTKLLQLKIYGEDLEDIIVTLIEEKFLDELRYSKSFVRGKFKNNQWGRNKIRQELQKRNVSDYCIRKGMDEIKEEAYEQTMQKLILSKYKQIGKAWTFESKQKIKRYMLQKGYEMDLIVDIIQQLELQ